MGKRRIRLILVPKGVTAFLLLITTAAMVGSIYVLAGRAYATEPSTIERIERMVAASPPTTNHLLALSMPLVANALVFIPWGFLLFVLLDVPSRRRAATYLITALCGALFAIALNLWQASLPTRVTTVWDVVANSAGTLCGAMLGHVRKQMHVTFDY